MNRIRTIVDKKENRKKFEHKAIQVAQPNMHTSDLQLTNQTLLDQELGFGTKCSIVELVKVIGIDVASHCICILKLVHHIGRECEQWNKY